MTAQRRLTAITIDYETWQPIPPGKRIDWEQDVFAPAELLLDLGDQCHVPITFMAEMGEYFWLVENDPPTGRRMKEQWQEAVLRGHDVQLHLHPSWLPELGARCAGGQWFWDFAFAKADDYPGDLTKLIARCQQELEHNLQLIDPEYRTVAFRAGTYQVQPFRRLFEALVSNGILADTSVFAGGCSAERGYDFRLAHHAHQPWFANPFDAQLVAASAERRLVEIPVTTFGAGERWFLDNAEGPRLASRYENWRSGPAAGGRPGAVSRLLGRLGLKSRRSDPVPSGPHPAGPDSEASVTAGLEHEYFVIIGHTKAELHIEAIATNLDRLRTRHGFEFASLAALTRAAHDDLAQAHQPDATMPAKSAVITSVKPQPISAVLPDELLPFDRLRILDLGSREDRSARMAAVRPWASVTTAAGKQDLADLEFAGNSFDSVCCAQSIGEAADPSQAFRELHRVLADGGLLLAAVPIAGGTAPAHAAASWRPAEHELRLRLQAAGFVDVSIARAGAEGGLESRRGPEGSPVWLLRGWKRARPAAPLERACEMMDWVYRMIQPEPIPEQEFTADEILRLGRGLCMAYAVVLLDMLGREGFDAEWLTMIAENHPRGRGPQRRDSHEVVLLHTAQGDVLLDPMANHVIPHTLEAVLNDPELAAPPLERDERYRSRGYELYTTAAWYSRVTEYWIRKHPRDRIRKQRVRAATGQRRAA